MTKKEKAKLHSYVNRKLKILSQMMILVDISDVQHAYALENQIQVDQWAHALIVGA